jgi:hypothetical protein
MPLEIILRSKEGTDLGKGGCEVVRYEKGVWVY